MTAARWIRPVTAPITQLFGQLPGQPWGVCGPGGHPGTDYGCPTGTPVLAASDGEVIYAGPASGFGDHAVSIYHPAEDVTTTYGHMSDHDFIAGATVPAGEQIGLSGAEGDVTGPHLHLELRPGRVDFAPYPPNIDPDAWLHAHGAYGGPYPPPPPSPGGFLVNMPTIDANGPLNMAAPVIRTAQGLLAARGAWIVPSNTSHPVFSTAIRWFQQTAGLPVDNVIGPLTWARLAQPLNGR